ncbi:MAG: Lipopolysaccharide assembly protein B [Luteibacter sp.]|uniref:tetratricopeptide repeat protein n=1 Tax=Luteibacter sp. TaxID=1886636 RepID=UPI001386589B|nr:tetratricopeptide repeat protein [Luteibacter sp.]KAF1004691.1 MAG: Lipopolysaccharide assembly protein B [Luteibacter sp.]
MQTTISRSERLRALLAQDPGNTGLTLAVATALYEEGDYRESDTTLANLSGGDVEVEHLRGLVSLSLSRFPEAVAIFSSLEQVDASATIRYNLAYALAMLDRHDEALARLDDDVYAVAPGATVLRLRVLHRLGRFDEAIALARQAPAIAEGQSLHGVLSMILFDQGDLPGAGAEAARSLESAEGATTAGMLALEDGESRHAARLFEQALAQSPHSGRAMLGRGLAQTSQGDFASAGDTLETAATMLRDHSGAWVTAGWARLMQGELAFAETDFRKAMDMDRGFSEAAGGLAMTLFQDGRRNDALHYARVALRLDPASLSGQYVSSLLAAADGATDSASEQMERLLNQPVGNNGPTLGNVLARYRRPA